MNNMPLKKSPETPYIKEVKRIWRKKHHISPKYSNALVEILKKTGIQYSMRFKPEKVARLVLENARKQGGPKKALKEIIEKEKSFQKIPKPSADIRPFREYRPTGAKVRTKSLPRKKIRKSYYGKY